MSIPTVGRGSARSRVSVPTGNGCSMGPTVVTVRVEPFEAVLACQFRQLVGPRPLSSAGQPVPTVGNRGRQ